MEMNKENIKLLPLVAVGLVKALGEVVLRPAIEDHIVEPVKARIEYYRTSE